MLRENNNVRPNWLLLGSAAAFSVGSLGRAHGGEGPQARRAERPQRGDAAVAHPALLHASRHDQALRVARNSVASGHVEDGAAGTSQTTSN